MTDFFVKPEDARFICHLCDELFKDIPDIKNHYKIQHIEKMPCIIQLRYPRKVCDVIKYNCEYCETQFSNNSLLENHLIKCILKATLIKENQELKIQIKKLELCNYEYKEIITKLLNIQK